MKKTLLLCTLLCIFSYSFSQTTAFTDRAAWEASAGATPCFTEDLEGFTSDTEFRAGPVQLNGFTIEQQGFDYSFRNLVETIPFQFGDNNGTNHLSLFTAADPDPGTTLLLTFDEPISAFYAEYTGAATFEVLMEVYNTDMGMLDSHTLQMSNVNRGIVLDDPSMPITSIVLKSANLLVGPVGQGFGMDNIAMVCAEDAPPARPLPLMKKWQMLSMLLVVFGASFFMMRRFL